MPKTRLYRVVLIVANLAGVIAAGLTQWGPGFGLDVAQIALIQSGLNILIVLARQILDSTTPTLPPAP